MSFLETGKPGLLRWILQQKEMFSGILRGLGDDDEETAVYVLATLRDRVLIPESLVPPGLRSVLFGSITLEQLVNISARESGGLNAEVAHKVLVMVCTDRSNGLMPDSRRQPYPLRGNPKRLLDLMKRLKPTEIKYHEDLLLAIVNSRPSLASAYLDEFPYNLEDHLSPTWPSAICFAANVVSSASKGFSWDFLIHQTSPQPSIDNVDVQSVLKCVCPRLFNRSVVNKGLLHSDPLVKHATLRLILENLKLLDSFINALNATGLTSLKQGIQNEVRILLPDPQVLFTLLNSLGNSNRKIGASLKRAAGYVGVSVEDRPDIKKLKTESAANYVDLDVGGISCGSDAPQNDETKSRKMTRDKFDEEIYQLYLSKLWMWEEFPTVTELLDDPEVYFQCKVLEALKIYHRDLKPVLEVSYDLFKVIPSDPVTLPHHLLQSLLAVLIEDTCGTAKSVSLCRILPQTYKYLQHFISLLLYLPTREIRSQSCVLAEAAMMSTGAFDSNPREIGAWFLFLPGNMEDHIFTERGGHEILQKLCPPIVSFLCDAVSTVGNNPIKFWDLIKLHHDPSHKERSFGFGPLIVCVLEKCMRLLISESGTFGHSEKSMISMYVCNTVIYLLQTQVEAGSLSSFIYHFLSHRLEGRLSMILGPENVTSEWRPFKYLFLLSESIIRNETCTIFNSDRNVLGSSCPVGDLLGEVKEVLGRHGDEMVVISKACYFAMLSAAPDDILKNIPTVLTIPDRLPGVPLSLLISSFFLDQSLLSRVSVVWPDIFFSGLELCVKVMSRESKHPGNYGYGSHLLATEVDTCSDNDSMNSASIAFSSFLIQAPFHVLFPAIIFSDYGKHRSRIEELLLAKLDKLASGQLISSFRLALFWVHQIQSSYRRKPSVSLECFESCYKLVHHILTKLLTANGESSFSSTVSALPIDSAEEVCNIVFFHPVVSASLNTSQHRHGDLIEEESVPDSLEDFIAFSRQSVSTLDQQVFKMLNTTFDLLSALYSSKSSCYDSGPTLVIGKAFKTAIHQMFLIFKKKFDDCLRRHDLTPLLPALYPILTLIRFISPFELLKLVKWIFGRVGLEDLILWRSLNLSPICVAFCVASSALEMLSRYLSHSNKKDASAFLLWGFFEKDFDAELVKFIYSKAIECSTRFKLHLADVCLFQVVSGLRKHNHKKETLVLGLEITRVVSITPREIISHCIQETNDTKSKLLLHLVQMSPLHMSVFGHLFAGLMNKNMLRSGDSDYAHEEYCLLLLPAALAYLRSCIATYGWLYFEKHELLISDYSEVLLNGFLHWKSFVTKSVFKIENDGELPSSRDQLLRLSTSSLLGQSVHMLHYYLSLRMNSIDECLNLFDSLCPRAAPLDDLLDLDVKKVNSCPSNQLLNLSIRVVAKISLCKMLLFPEGDLMHVRPLMEPKENDLKLTGCKRLELSKMRFIDALVCSWQRIVKKFPTSFDDSENQNTLVLFIKALEVHLLRCIDEFIIQMRDTLVEQASLPFVEKIVRSSLLHRFADPMTMNLLRQILVSLSSGNIPSGLFLQMLLAHSQLLPAIDTISGSNSSPVSGMLTKPISGILRSQILPLTNWSCTERSESNKKQLETIKLLRTLFQLKTSQCGSLPEEDTGVSYKELVFLLLSCYGATLSEFDLEIYNLMRYAQLSDGNYGEIAAHDYIWGTAALRMRTERSRELNAMVNDNMYEIEMDCRRAQFRDNLPIDPKLCVATVLHFPYERVLSKLPQDNAANVFELYDPVFILHFSYHCLSRDYVDPVEFAGLGLLAVAFVSLSSPDDGMRKLGYKVLGTFSERLETCQRKREVTRLRLLAYLQNGINEPWQRIPSVIAVFVAEASLILLDPSHDHYSAISKHLMQSPRANFQRIPLFHEFFWSTSVNHKIEQLWMLRLLFTGINIEDDARIYINSSVFDILLSYYASPLSDYESKVWVLQIVKKSVKLQKMARHLIEKCGLILWMSSVLSSSMNPGGDENIYSFDKLTMLLEVVADVLNLRSTMEWLQNYALEELSNLSSQLLKIFSVHTHLVERNLKLIISVLEVITSALRISQKREICQPHFTVSLKGFCQAYESFDLQQSVEGHPYRESVLKAILMSPPAINMLQMDQRELSSFLMWAVSTALVSDSHHMPLPQETYPSKQIHVEDGTMENSLTLNLLRWLVASVILQSISCGRNKTDFTFIWRQANMESFMSFLKGKCANKNSKSISEKTLAATINYLLQQQQQHHVRMTPNVLPSVVSALSLLLFIDASPATGSASSLNNGNSLPLHWSKIRCPTEANPSWRWSYDQLWVDPSFTQTDLEKMEERHACQTLLVVISEALERTSSECEIRLLAAEDLENAGVFPWERSMLGVE